LVTRRSIQNGGLVAKQTHHENNIANFMEVLDEFSLFYDYYVLFNYFVSFWKHKKYDLFKKNFSKEKVNISQHGTKEMYGSYTFQVSYEFLL